MKAFFPLYLVPFLLTYAPAFADCKGDLAAVVDATQAAGAMRMESQFSRDGKSVHQTISEFSPPDQLRQTTTTTNGQRVTTVIVSGLKSWFIVKLAGEPEPPAKEFKSGHVEEFTKWKLPKEPIAECKTEVSSDKSEVVHFKWKQVGQGASLLTDALADSKTHILRSVTSHLVRDNGSVDSEEESIFRPIPSFIVKPPETK